MNELIRELQTQEHFRPLKIETNVSKIMEEEIFKAADAEELRGRHEDALRKMAAKYKPAVEKMKAIMQLLGIETIDDTQYLEDSGEIKMIGTRRSTTAQPGASSANDLTIELEVNLIGGVQSWRSSERLTVSVRKAGEQHSRWSGWERMHLAFKLKTSTIAKKILDDIIPRFALGDEGWGAKYTPKARYKRQCAICWANIPAGTRHLRTSSGHAVCAACARRAGGMLGEGVWVKDTLIILNEDEIFKPASKKDLAGRAEQANQRRSAKDKEWAAKHDGLMPDTCPECKANLREIGVDEYGTASWSGVMRYDGTWDDSADNIDYDNFDTSGYHCPECNNEVYRNADFDLEELQEARLREDDEGENAEIFKPADKAELVGRREAAYQRKKAGFQKYAKDWKISSLSLTNPSEDSNDRDTGMYMWWRNNKQWKESGIKKIDADWDAIRFIFEEPLSRTKATKLVHDFIQDWAHKPGTEDKTMSVGDMVYLDPTGTSAWERRDLGRITAIDGNEVKIRFHHHGNAFMDVSRLTYVKDTNSWEVAYDREFRKKMPQKKGMPKVGATCRVLLPKEEQVTARYSHMDTVLGTVESVDGNTVNVTYRPPKVDWQNPDKPVKFKALDISELEYNWKQKYWIEIAVHEEEEE